MRILTRRPIMLAATTAAFALMGLTLALPAVATSAADTAPDGSSTAAATVAPGVPTPDVLDVDLADGTTTDHAQGLPATTWGAPATSHDLSLDKSVASYNGTTDATSYAMTGQWSKLTAGFTVECAFRYDGTALSSASGGLCSNNYAGGAAVEVTNSQLAWAVDVDGTYLFDETAIKPGTWYDMVGTWDGQTMDLYLNGVLAESVPAAGSLTVPRADAQNWFLGAGSDLNNGMRAPLQSSISTSRIWDAVLTPDQIHSLAGVSGVAEAVAPTAPTPDVLNVDFADGTTTDRAQGLVPAVKGSPAIAQDTTLGHEAATFNGSSDALLYPFVNQWNKLSGGLSLECRFRWNGSTLPTAAQSAICSNAQSGGADLQIDSGQLAFSINVGGYKYTHVAITPGVWYDAVATWDGFTNRLYLNGQLVAFIAAQGALTAPVAGAQNLTVGADSAGGGGFETPSPVSVSTARVWSKALEPAQVAAVAATSGSLTGAPQPSVLDVDVADGTPLDHAQGLPVTVRGTPAIATDGAAGQDVVSFNGSTDAYQYPLAAQWSKMTTGLTYECIFRWDGDTIPTTGQNAICSNAQAGGADMQIDSGQLAFSIDVGGYQYVRTPIVPHVWYDAVATWNGTTASLYLDGQPMASVPASGAITVPAADAQLFTIGADSAAGGGFETPSPISVRAARIWSTALSAAQVTAQASHPITVTSTGHGTASASLATAAPGKTVTLTATPDAGYHLTGWQVTDPTDGSVTIADDNTFAMPRTAVSVQARFAPNTYTVRYDANGGSGSMAATSLTYDAAQALPADTFTRAGYTFAGWATSAAGGPAYTDGEQVSDLTATDGGTVTLYAAWLPVGAHQLRVTSGAHGTAGTTSTWWAQTGSTVTLTATPDTGYHLDTWTASTPTGLSVTAAGTFTMPDADVAVQGTFAANGYTVHYLGNGADGGVMPDSSFVYDQTETLAPDGFGRDGYAFTGWSTSPTGAVVYGDMDSVSNLTATNGATVTLYAQWRHLSVRPGSWKSLAPGFVTDTFHLAAVPVSGAVSQPLLGLWNGAAPTSFTKVGGDSWLDVSASGTVTGRAPREVPQDAGTITVQATNGTTTSQLLVEVPVQALSASPQVQAASWNAWADGSKVDDAVGKNLAVIAAQGIGVIGFQDGGNAMAQQVGEALGWQSHGAGDVGIVSAYPMTTAATVFPSDGMPAAAATVDLRGDPVRIWDVHLDEGDDGPDRACAGNATASDLVAHELTTARYAEAKTVVKAMSSDLRGRTPVLMLGDLASPSASDWTPATSSSHCGAGAVAWPVPVAFTRAGLVDSFRVAEPNPVTDPGTTWSPIVATDAAGNPVPQDRVDYVDYTPGALHVVESHTLTVGWPSATDVADNSWASDHAAVATTFDVGGRGLPGIGSPGQASGPVPVASVGTDTIAYQVGQGPANAAALLQDVGATASLGGSTLSADLSGVDFGTPGWYTVLVTASRKGLTSQPVAVTVRVAPVPGLALGSSTATFAVGQPITQAAVLAQFEPVLDVFGASHVDLSQVRATKPGSYPVTVTASDAWGFEGSATATVVITG